MEVDIYIPSIKLAIEYDGIAWHKEDKRDREIRKYRICQNNGIRLLRLMEKPPKNGILLTERNSMIVLPNGAFTSAMEEKSLSSKAIR